MAEGGEVGGAGPGVAITTEPSKALVFNAPFTMRQKANLRLINNSIKTYYYQVKSTKTKGFIPTPTSGVIKPNEQIVLMINCEALPSAPANDRLTVEYVDAPDTAEKCDRSAFEAAASVNRRVVLIQVNE